MADRVKALSMFAAFVGGSFGALLWAAHVNKTAATVTAERVQCEAVRTADGVVAVVIGAPQ